LQPAFVQVLPLLVGCSRHQKEALDRRLILLQWLHTFVQPPLVFQISL
jgi:hypothetical protein